MSSSRLGGGNEWEEESRGIECIFGNKYNLNELAVNWKWAIQGYLTRGSPLASPPPCSLSLRSTPSSSPFFFFPLPSARTFSLFPSIRSFETLPSFRRSKRYFRRQIPPQQRETFRTWGCFPLTRLLFFPLPCTPRSSVFPPLLLLPFPEVGQTEFDRPVDTRHLPYVLCPLHQSLYSRWNGDTVTWGQLLRMSCASILQLTVYNTRCNYCREYSRRGDFEVKGGEREREELNLMQRE